MKKKKVLDFEHRFGKSLREIWINCSRLFFFLGSNRPAKCKRAKGRASKWTRKSVAEMVIIFSSKHNQSPTESRC